MKNLITYELAEYILNFTDWGSTFKSILFTCKRWNNLQLKIIPNGRSIFANHLTTLIKLCPDKPWDWYKLSSNPNITWDIICTNYDKPWDWYELSSNPKITWDIVCTNPDKAWSWEGLSQNPNITWDIICLNPEEPWQWKELSWNPNITWDIISDKPWDWEGI